MSYCRLIDADVYVYPGSDGFHCCMCSLSPADFVTQSADVMAAHLTGHMAVGDYVPADVIPAIHADAEIDAFGWRSGGTP